MKFAIPFDYSMHNYLLRYYLAETRPRSRYRRADSARCRRRRWSPICAPTTSTASLRPINGLPARDLSTASASCTSCPRKSGTAIPAAAFAASQGIHHPDFAEQLCGADCGRSWTRPPIASKAENRKQIAEAIAPANYINAAGHGAGAGADRHLCGRPRRGEDATPSAIDFDPFPWQSLCGVDADANEALGPDQGRRRLQGKVAEQVYPRRPTPRKAHEGNGADTAYDVGLQSRSP